MFSEYRQGQNIPYSSLSIYFLGKVGIVNTCSACLYLPKIVLVSNHLAVTEMCTEKHGSLHRGGRCRGFRSAQDGKCLRGLGVPAFPHGFLACHSPLVGSTLSVLVVQCPAGFSQAAAVRASRTAPDFRCPHSSVSEERTCFPVSSDKNPGE